MARIIDEVKIFVKAGNGGKGCDSRTYISEKKFIPTGGEGGRGGNILMRADSNVNSLKTFLYQRRFAAESGTAGGSEHKKGKKGRDLLIAVPCGTQVFEAEKHFLIRDLARAGEEVVLVQGGKGGGGNEGGKEAQPGQAGEALHLTLSLKIPAEVFLVGLPNSGKSTLLNRLTGSHVKEETYPFSTKYPELGVYETSSFEKIHLCELPSLYRESPQGRGVGFDFLKHLARAKLVFLMLDPLNDFAASLEEGRQVLLNVMGHYDAVFQEMRRVVVVNKMDLPEAREKLARQKFRPPEPIFLISAKTGEGIEPLMNFAAQEIRERSHA